MTTAAIQGVPGAFSHSAAMDSLGSDVQIQECHRFEDLFASVMSGEAEYGVVPVENTLAGAVQRSMDLLLEHPLHVVAEVRVRIRLCLAAPAGRALGEIGSAASHPVALQQCHGFFSRHPTIEPVAAFDTAGSVRDVMRGAADYDAAIGSMLAAKLYGAEVLEEDLEDDRQNYTRFLVVSKRPAAVPETNVKTALVFTLPHEPGSLHAALGCLVEHRVNLTRLESRPIPGRPWEYRFYADLTGSPASAQSLAVESLRVVTRSVRVLGVYRGAMEAAAERTSI